MQTGADARSAIDRRSWPVIRAPAGETRKATSSATSSGSIARPSGVAAMSCSVTRGSVLA